ncbi:hypothetical protein QYE76_029831 [Lolium multiflorum]|uniref:Uncharacterized protein n=1 Tax=Lolium multiflorum TaxID=4521 RepID=A0AAD8QNM3_LOLMU|nr:hypothetical protein QYE76_029831 [Lolium multiflorum]
MQGKAPWVSYEVNGNAYDKPYYLADGIYPDWATLVKIVRNPNSEKARRFAKMQEACRKDVERGFGVLQARWAIVRHPARTWSLKTMHEVMTCCVIMHNMIVQNERPDGRNEHHWDFQEQFEEIIAAVVAFIRVVDLILPVLAGLVIGLVLYNAAMSGAAGRANSAIIGLVRDDTSRSGGPGKANATIVARERSMICPPASWSDASIGHSQVR